MNKTSSCYFTGLRVNAVSCARLCYNKIAIRTKNRVINDLQLFSSLSIPCKQSLHYSRYSGHPLEFDAQRARLANATKGQNRNRRRKPSGPGRQRLSLGQSPRLVGSTVDEFLSWSAEFVYFDIYSGMAEFLQRSMTAKSREKQPSPLAPNGKLLIEMQRLKASGRLPSKYDATCIFVVSFHFLSTPSFSALERVRKGTGCPVFQ